MAVAEKHLGKNPAHAGYPWFGNYEELGKTEARQQFLSLVDGIDEQTKSLAITDRGKPVAVIMGYKQFKALVDVLKKNADATQQNPFDGLVVHVGDLEKSNKKVNALFQKSLKKSAESI